MDLFYVISAASLVASNNILREIASKGKAFTKENSFVAGYMLASLGRAVLHGDTDTVVGKAAYITSWKVSVAGTKTSISFLPYC